MRSGRCRPGVRGQCTVRYHHLGDRTGVGWAWSILPPPLKVYSECPEGRRSDCLLLPAHHKGWGLPGRSCAFWGGTWFSSAGTGMVGAGCPERGTWWVMVARCQARYFGAVKARSSIYYLKIIKKFLWAYITEILQVQFYYKFRPNHPE